MSPALDRSPARDKDEGVGAELGVEQERLEAPLAAVHVGTGDADLTRVIPPRVLGQSEDGRDIFESLRELSEKGCEGGAVLESTALVDEALRGLLAGFVASAGHQLQFSFPRPRPADLREILGLDARLVDPAVGTDRLANEGQKILADRGASGVGDAGKCARVEPDFPKAHIVDLATVRH